MIAVTHIARKILAWDFITVKAWAEEPLAGFEETSQWFSLTAESGPNLLIRRDDHPEFKGDTEF